MKYRTLAPVSPCPSRHSAPCTAENAKLKERLDQSEQTVDELTDFRTQALARLAAQHEEIVHLHEAADASNRVTRLPSARTTVIGSCS